MTSREDDARQSTIRFSSLNGLAFPWRFWSDEIECFRLGVRGCDSVGLLLKVVGSSWRPGVGEGAIWGRGEAEREPCEDGAWSEAVTRDAFPAGLTG